MSSKAVPTFVQHFRCHIILVMFLLIVALILMGSDIISRQNGVVAVGNLQTCNMSCHCNLPTSGNETIKDVPSDSSTNFLVADLTGEKERSHLISGHIHDSLVIVANFAAIWFPNGRNGSDNSMMMCQWMKLTLGEGNTGSAAALYEELPLRKESEDYYGCPLFIYNLSYEKHHGIMHCVVQINQQMTIQSMNFDITVLHKPEKPTITVNGLSNSTYTSMFGEEVNLTCHYNEKLPGVPKGQLVWERLLNKIEFETPMAKFQPTLSFPLVSLHENDKFACYISNPHGVSYAQVNLVVLPPAQNLRHRR